MFHGLAESIEEPVSDADLLGIGNEAVRIVAQRTKRGADVDHHIFKPYSEGYAKERIGHSLRPFPVDLARTGRMMAALMATPQADGSVKVGFTDEEANLRAGFHNEGVKGRTAVNEVARQVPARTNRGGYRKYREGETRTLTTVHGHTRAVNLPQREFMDIRHPDEVSELADSFGDLVIRRIEKEIR